MKIFNNTLITFSLYFGTLYADDHVISYGMDDLTQWKHFMCTKDDLNRWKELFRCSKSFYLTPFLRCGDELGFDVAWVGFTNNHKDMGIVQDFWFSDEASETFAKWESLTDCASQGYYMAIEARTPKVQFEEGKNTFWAIMEVVR